MKRIFFVFFIFFFASIEVHAQSHNESELVSSSTLISGWDVENLEETSKSLNTSNHTNSARSIDLVDNDTRLFVHARSTRNVVSYKLVTPGDISSAVYISEFDTSPYLGSKSQSSAGHGVYIDRNNLERMWLWNRTEVWQFDLSTPGDITTATKSGYKNLSSYVTRGHDIDFRPDGKVFYVEDRNQETVHQFILAQPWDIETLKWEYTLDISSHHTAVRGIEFDPTGRIMFLLDTSLKEIQQYKLDESWEISTATFDKSMPVNISNPRGLTWNENGTSAYVMNTSNGRITQYDMKSIPTFVQLSSPYNEKRNLSFPVNLKWEALNNAEYYDVQISASENFSDIVKEAGSEGTTLSTTVLNDTTGYFWRVRARVNEQTSQWSDIWSFETELRVPEVPIWDSKNEIYVSTRPKVYWISPVRAETFHLQLSGNIDFNNPKLNVESIDSAHFKIEEELNGGSTYYWRVRAGNDSGYSEWSEVWEFTANKEPKVVELKEPKNAESVNENPTLYWGTSISVDSYHLQLSKDYDFAEKKLDVKDIKDTEYMVEEKLQNNREYYWRVRAVYQNDYSDWSETQSFTVGNATSTNQYDSPIVFELQQNYPNPFNPTTQIKYSIPEATHVSLDVYNTLGQLVANLVNEYQSTGLHEVSFDASNLSTGLYLYRIQTKSYSETRRMMLMK